MLSTLGLYRFLTGLAEPLADVVVRVGAREESAGLRRERLGRDLAPEPVDTWWHASSLGEVAALEPVLGRARARGWAGAFAVTTSTVTGRNAASRFWGTRVSLAPLDFPGVTRRVLEARRPRSLILVETELWPNWLTSALDRGVAVGIVNGRVSERSWGRYRRVRSLFRPLLERVAAVAARHPADAERLVALGARATAVRVTGDTKHDRLGRESPAVLPWKEAIVWTAGSVHPGEERMLLPVFQRLRRRFPALKLVLALRHPSSWPHLEEDLARRGLTAARRSHPRAEDAAADLLVLDTHGELPGYYAASRMAFVGGTLVEVGGHNLVEAALAGVPILFGPQVETVKEDAQALLVGGGARQVRDEGEVEETLRQWLAHPEDARRVGAKAAETAESLRGASERALAWLREREVLQGDSSGA